MDASIMKKTLSIYLVAVVLMVTSTSLQACPELLDYEFRRLNGDETVKLCDEYADKVVLVVNTASKCAFTPQYDGLEKLYAELKDDGLVVIGFPSNDFANQEPGSEQQIQDFCRLTYSVQFPMFEKTSVKGDGAHPFYKALAKAAGESPSWNFHKYLIGRDGTFIKVYSSFTSPSSGRLRKAIDKALAEQP